MTKKKRTVITEESHEIWIIRQGQDELPETAAEEATDTSSGVSISPLDKVPQEQCQIPADVEEDSKS